MSPSSEPRSRFALHRCICTSRSSRSKAQVVRAVVIRSLTLFLAVAVFVSGTPAVPKTLKDVSLSATAEFTFWLQVKNPVPRLYEFLMGVEVVKGQEKQEARDARVSRIEILPGNVTLQEGQQVSFSAIAYDVQNNQVGGVKFKWSARDEGRARNTHINQRGDFKATAAGTFNVMVEGASQKATVAVIVVEGLRKHRGEDTPLDIKIRSTRDLPPSQAQAMRDKKVRGDNRKAVRRVTKNASTGSSQGMFAHAGRVRKANSNKPTLFEPATPYFLDDGWGDSNYFSADDPGNRRDNPPGAPLDGGAGSGNFDFTAPVLSLPGRGIDLSLSLTYRSRLWNKAGNNINFDIDRDWPAPGWNIGFGKMAGMGVYNGAMLIDGNSQRHPYSSVVTVYNWGTTCVAHTIDGTFIDYSYTSGTNGIMLYGQATLANGTRIDYNVNGPAGLYPTRITDANGNYITITYVNNTGPRIQTVTDTLGRYVNFHYDAGNRLTAITSAGLSSGTRTLVRLHYAQLTLNYSFTRTLNPITRESAPWVIDAIYFPGSNTGYWLSQSASAYSTYGMLKKVSERRGMTFTGSNPVPPGQGTTEQGAITAGQTTREEVYNYPLNPSDASGTQASNLSDAPSVVRQTD